MLEHLRVVAVILALGALAATDASADCAKTLTEARAAIKDAESAVGRAKDAGRKAAGGPLSKAKKGVLHAEAECKTDKDIRKQAEATREAREAQGHAEEARMLAEQL